MLRRRLCALLRKQAAAAVVQWYPPRLSSRYPPRPRSTCPVGRGSDAPRTVSLAGLVALPRPFDTFVNAYVPGGRLEALAFTRSVIVTPASMTPEVELAVSQDGVLIE